MGKARACFKRYLEIEIVDYFSKVIALAKNLTQALNDVPNPGEDPYFKLSAGTEVNIQSFQNYVELLLENIIHRKRILILCTNLKDEKDQNTIESIELCFEYNRILGRFVSINCSVNEKSKHNCMKRVRLPTLSNY